MYEIPMNEVTKDFEICWKYAGMHLQKMAGGQINSWIRAHLNPPFLEHLSFRLGNQLFFIRLVDVDECVVGPGRLDGLLKIANGCNGYACIMPMRKSGTSWAPVNNGWGLEDARTGQVINPVELISDKLIEMTDWELHDFAIQIVRDSISQKGLKLMSWHSDPDIEPSLWFIGENGPEWVIVREARYPKMEAILPANWQEIAKNCERLSKKGNFASVCFMACDESCGNKLYRGYPSNIKYLGLQPISLYSK